VTPGEELRVAFGWSEGRGHRLVLPLAVSVRCISASVVAIEARPPTLALGGGERLVALIASVGHAAIIGNASP
jgi:hypothetical protein